MHDPEDSRAVRIMELETKRQNFLFLLNDPTVPQPDKEKIARLLAQMEDELRHILEDEQL